MAKRQRRARREITLRGLPTSPGIAIGRVFFFGQKALKPENKIIAQEDVDRELHRFDAALEKTRQSMEITREKAVKELGEIVGRIFDSHLLILEDVMLLEEVQDKISQERNSADYALYTVMSKTYNTLLAQKKDYFRERADDVRDVGIRVLFNLSGKSDRLEIQTDEPVIIAARIITPSEIVHLDRSLISGVMTDIGGVTSHTAILTRALEVPAVVGLKKVSMFADRTEIAVINGNSGKVILNPTPANQKLYRSKQERFQQFHTRLVDIRGLPAETTDGHKVELMANIELPNELGTADNHGAEGVGLFRTEYMYLLQNQFPSEEEQFNEYKNLAEKMAPRPVTIRTFDLGGDKAPRELEIGREANPFMGFRAVRISLARPELFKIQIRAVLRASVYGNIKIMFPLVTGIDELRKIKHVFRSVKQDLDREGVPYNKDLETGVMIEVPSAVIMAPELAKEVDFFSIGTNDLIQFTLAADRGNEMVAHLFQDLHPAILRMVKMTVEAGHNRGLKVSMCGEMASDPLATVILIGLGVDMLSVSPLALLEVKKILRSVSFEYAHDFANFVLSRRTYKDIRKEAKKMMKDKFADLPIWFSNHNDSH